MTLHWVSERSDHENGLRSWTWVSYEQGYDHPQYGKSFGLGPAVLAVNGHYEEGKLVLDIPVAGWPLVLAAIAIVVMFVGACIGLLLERRKK
jgi:hypothetical protein